MKLYALKSPDGTLRKTEVFSTKRDCMFAAFEVICSCNPGWRSAYWKQFERFERAAKKQGWRAVPVSVVEVEE